MITTQCSGGGPMDYCMTHCVCICVLVILLFAQKDNEWLCSQIMHVHLSYG